MIKRFLFLVLLINGFIFGGIILQAQNLIPNPSFEMHSTCPSYQGEWHYAVSWDTVPGHGSANDYFHSCSPTNSNPNGMGVPKNLVGFQVPVAGNAYMGIICYANYYANVREYILNKLFCPLQNGKKYKAGFFVNRSNKMRYAIDQMGMYIGDTIYGSGGPPYMLNAYTPQIKNNTGNILQDTINWIEISGTFTAQGNEKYIAIGNFATDSNTMVKDSVGPLGNNGTYYLIDSVYVIPINPQITISATSSICAGDTALLQASGSDVYYWFDSANMSDTLGTDSMLSATPTVTTTYVVHGCCPGQYTITVQVAAAPPPFSLGNDTVLCNGNTLLVTAPPGYTYQWQNGATGSALSLTQAGTYWVEASNACGSVSDTVTVQVITAPPPFTLGNDTMLCAGDTLALTAPPGYAYQWQNGATGSALSLTQAGTYWVQLSNQCGTAGDTVLVNYLIPSILNLGKDTILCNNDTFLLYGGNWMGYQWSTGTTNDSVSITGSDTSYLINLMVTDENGCRAKDTINISFSSCLGVNNDFSITGVLIYPNPSIGHLYMQLQGRFDNKSISVEIIDGRGRPVQRSTISQFENNIAKVDLSNCAAGIYLIKITSGEEVFYRKILHVCPKNGE